MAKYVVLFLAVVILPQFLLHAEKVWIDRDKVYCGHLDCTRVATFNGEKFCNPCDTTHYCDCKHTREPLPYLYACQGGAQCQVTDRFGSCQKTQSEEFCREIDTVYREV
ncbi:uncharacterized protein LOC128729132 [Anopheles nili]|uniref:uncharacterized protein LOC128729132 n=1 Tax=Anopheles nili TaxID=185578 RepID=UPI00237A4429|nr:uncharacterized protein LOC128729132 [Anopheles nili]